MPQYTRNPALDESSLASDPLRQFEHWLAEAQSAELVEPTAMALATATPDGRPSVRIVLFKGLDDGGLTFYTNYTSRKGCDLRDNPRAAAVFWWDRLERQVRVEGAVERLSREMSERYAQSRPRASQISAYTSRQSQVVASRMELEQRFAETEKLYAGRPVPLSEAWGGYRLRPERFEFWQGRRDRLHDRLIYDRDGPVWRIRRLEP